MNPISLHRRTLLGAAASLAAGAAWAQPAPATVRIGYQKSSTLTVVLKAQGTLERRLAPLNAKVSWHEFTSGLPLLEALNQGPAKARQGVAKVVSACPSRRATLCVLPHAQGAQRRGTGAGDLPLGLPRQGAACGVAHACKARALRRAGALHATPWRGNATPCLALAGPNNLDFSADVADTVPVFAQAAGAQLTFVAQEAPSPTAQAIVVRADSPLRSVADLKGRKVGFAKAAGAHYLLIAALEQAGLSFKDIEPAYLTPADGRAAFERGAIDAWVIWDPFLSAAQRQSNARVLADGTGIASYQRYYLASTKFAQARADVLEVIYAELAKAGQWVKANPDAAAALLAPVWGVDVPTVLQANGRRSYAVRAAVPAGLAEQQKIADAFFAEKLLPKRVNALDIPLFKPGSAT